MTGPLHGPWPRPSPAVETELNRVLAELVEEHDMVPVDVTELMRPKTDREQFLAALEAETE